MPSAQTLETLRNIFYAYHGNLGLKESDADVWFINQGSRMLDRLGNWPHNMGRHVVTLVAGDFHIVLPRQVRVVKHAFLQAVGNGSITGHSFAGKKWPMRGPVNIVDINNLFPDLTDTSIRSGPALWGDGWRPLVMPDAGIEGLSLPADLANVAADSAVADHLSMVVAPPADQTYFLDLYVYKYTPDLAVETDTNFWSTNYPKELMLAAKHTYEESMNNFPTAAKILDQIQPGLIAYDRDQVDQAQVRLPRGVYTAEVST